MFDGNEMILADKRWCQRSALVNGYVCGTGEALLRVYGTKFLQIKIDLQGHMDSTLVPNFIKGHWNFLHRSK